MNDSAANTPLPSSPPPNSFVDPYVETSTPNRQDDPRLPDTGRSYTPDTINQPNPSLALTPTTVARTTAHTLADGERYRPPTFDQAQQAHSRGFSVLVHMDAMLRSGPVTKWTTIFWDVRRNYAGFRAALNDVIINNLNQMMDEDESTNMVTTVWQCKLTDQAIVTKLDEIIATNYHPVQSQMSIMSIRDHCLKVEVNGGSLGRPSRLAITQGERIEVNEADTRSERSGQAEAQDKKRKSMMRFMGGLPRSVSNNFLTKAKKKEDGDAEPKQANDGKADKGVRKPGARLRDDRSVAETGEPETF